MSLVLQEISRAYTLDGSELKQVYQNRLVEGVDFERWDYLVTDDRAYSLYETFNPVTSTMTGKWKRISEDVPQHDDLFVCNYSIYTHNFDYNQLRTTLYVHDGNVKMLNHIGTMTNYFFYQTIPSFTSKGSFSVLFKTNGNIGHRVCANVVTFENGTTWTPTNSGWYYSGNENSWNLQEMISAPHGYAFESLVGNKGDEVLFSLTPIKLLRPCPPNLSSQNKLHQIGECGMIDSVSGKFYGNANSKGSFSVYNDEI